MSGSELEYGSGTVSFTITPHGGLITVLVVRYAIIYTTHSKLCIQCFHGLLGLMLTLLILVGDNNVSLGPSYVFVRLPCESKSSVSYRQRIQVSGA